METYGDDDQQTGTPDEVKVGVADKAVASGETTITTSGLGSCLAITLYDDATNTAGMLHPMLPSIEDGSDDTVERFVDTGLPAVHAAMVEAGGDPDRFVATIAGGSDMFDFSNGGDSIGERNVGVARDLIAERGIPIRGQDVGGDHGRTVRIDAATGRVVVKRAHDDTVEL